MVSRFQLGSPKTKAGFVGVETSQVNLATHRRFDGTNCQRAALSLSFSIHPTESRVS